MRPGPFHLNRRPRASCERPEHEISRSRLSAPSPSLHRPPSWASRPGCGLPTVANPKAWATTRTGIIFRALTGMLRRTAPLYGLAVVVALAVFPALAAAQGSDTIYDEAGVLTGPEERRVQQAFDSAQEETGQPLYAFLVPNEGVEGQEARQELLTREATEV